MVITQDSESCNPSSNLGGTSFFFRTRPCLTNGTYPKLAAYLFMVPCGLVARIRRFHRRGRGSIPRMGDFFSLTCLVSPYFILEDMSWHITKAPVVQW